MNKPGVVTILFGVRNMDDLRNALSYLNSASEERDYSVLDSFASLDVGGNTSATTANRARRAWTLA